MLDVKFPTYGLQTLTLDQGVTKLSGLAAWGGGVEVPLCIWARTHMNGTVHARTVPWLHVWCKQGHKRPCNARATLAPTQCRNARASGDVALAETIALAWHHDTTANGVCACGNASTRLILMALLAPMQRHDTRANGRCACGNTSSHPMLTALLAHVRHHNASASRGCKCTHVSHSCKPRDHGPVVGRGP